MATHDYIISNASGAAVRADLNNALAAIVSNNSNASSPATTYAYQWWADTTTGQLKLRNSANSAWITIFELDGTMLMEDGTVSAPGLAFASDLDTGFFRGTTNKIGVATGGVERLTLNSTEAVFNDGSNDVDFRVESNGNTHMLFVDGGNDRVGIGKNPATYNFEVNGGTSNTVASFESTDATARIVFKDNSGEAFVGGTGDAVTFYTSSSATERARIDSSGRLLVGSSSTREVGYGDNASLQLEGTSYPKAAISSILNSNNANGPSINLAKSRGTSNGTSTVVQNNDILGLIAFSGGDGTDIRTMGARIQASVDGTPGANDMPGRLTFSTTADGASSPTERLRLDSSGRLLVGTSSAPPVTGSQVPIAYFSGNKSDSTKEGALGLSRGSAATAADQGIGRIEFTDSAGAVYGRITSVTDAAPGSNDYPGRLSFHTTADGASSPTERVKILSSGAMLVPYIYATTSASAANVIVGSDGNLFRSTSSGKYKTQVEDLQDSYADALLNCRPVWYRSTCELDDATYGYWGFIAEEVAEIDPRLIHWKKTEITYDEEGKTIETACEPEAEGVQYDRFVPHLLNLIKRQQAAIETLETKVAALEAG